ncbi:MAG: glycosyltransferase family 2 protein [Terriglobia bacterium]
MFFSIVIPCFNAEPYLAETLESVLRQRHKEFEVLIVDDASTDRTLQIARSYSERDNRIRVIACHKGSGGPATPRNLGIVESRGDYVALLDADDVWNENKLLHDAEFLESHAADILFSGAYYFRDRVDQVVCTKAPRPIDWTLQFRNSIPILTVCIKRDLFARYDLWFDPDPVLHEDYHLFLTAYLRGARIVCRPGIDSYYRMNVSSSRFWRDDFGGSMRRHVYTLTKIACENSIALPKFLSALVMCVSMLYVKRLRGEDEWGRSKTTVGYCRT